MSWTRVSAVLPAVFAACAKVTAAEESIDAGPSQPAVTAIEPQPGAVAGNSQFVVHFSEAMDEGQLLAASGRSETVVLTAEADVERAAAAIEHSELSAHERSLLVPAEPDIAADRKSITLVPDHVLAAGNYFLLISPRLKDADGRKLAGSGMRFAYQVAPPPRKARLVSPLPGGDAPSNLLMVRAFADAGRVALWGPGGSEVASADAHGDVPLALNSALMPGVKYTLALDGVPDDAQSFTAASCARTAAPAMLAGQAQLSVRDTSVLVSLTLDWPATVKVMIADSGEPCSGECVTASAYVSCRAAACGPQLFGCKVELDVDGLAPASDHVLRVVAEDDLGHLMRGPLQSFTTVAPLPRLVISEVMAAPPSPEPEAEYAELLNLGPGLAVLDAMALMADDGVARPLVASLPPVPVTLVPGARALAVGSDFNPARYLLPPGLPILRASTQRLLGRGLADDAPPAFRLMLQGAELSRFPGGGPACPAGASLQRDESVPPQSDATWTCGSIGGTPGKGP
ncbi:MAG: Ig-like domain-containing protein [Myxococcales bacterium]